MSNRNSENVQLETQAQKLQDKAALIPLIGLLFLMPPIAGIFQIESKFFGIPFTLLYLFIVWAGLIVGTFILSRSLSHKLPDQNLIDKQSDDVLS